jgi:uncharacterized protein
MTKSIRIDKDIPMQTRDGITLRSDVYRPDDNGKYPAIVTRTPYSKDYSGNSDFLAAMDVAFAGYVMVVQDTRGRFTSEGSFTPGMPEGQDGYDAVEWAASEPWCDGNVGMTGGSYLGRNQWQAAMEVPPSLKAIAPQIATAGVFSDTRLTGPVDFEQNLSWTATMMVDMIDKLEKEGKDVTEMRKSVMHARFNMDEVFNHLPVKDIPHFQYEGIAHAFQPDRLEAILSLFQKEEDLFWSYEKVQVPAFHAGGWYDIFSGSLFQAPQMMKERGGTDIARDGQYIFCGPWSHGANLLAYVGGLHFGPVARGMAAFAKERHIAFFDKYLKGKEVTIPKVRYFVMGLNKWRNAESWPLPQTDWQRFYLHSRGQANSADGNGSLSREEPGTENADLYIYDPMNPVPYLGGRSLPTGTLVPGPFDQTPIEKRSDVLCYTTSELMEAVEITGPIKLHLFASTTVVDTDFTAKLVDVHPNGAAYNLAEGCLRAKFRNSLLKPELLSPGEVVEYEIDMAVTSNLFKPGHRIRLDISSSNFPRIDRNMNTGNPFAEDSEGIPALQTIFHQKDRASYIDLPIIPADKT